ncbi:MAG: TlpA disulfide reductase family protein [Rhodocyclaceae bacterium]|nr:TlpA disulfide reductase family protein [Rhodocyclaceae bacterium]
MALVAILPAPTVAQAAALDFELAGEGGFVRLSALPPQITVVNFWRSDCPPCVREMPHLAALAQRGNVRVVTVAVQRRAETLAAPEAVRSALRPPMISLHAPTESRGLLARFGNPVQALPHTVVLDAARKVCATRTGEVDHAWLNAALEFCRAA